MTNAPVDTTADFDPDPNSPQGIAARWISELDQAEKFQKKYLERCKKINDRYIDERRNNLVSGTSKRAYSVLWSNIETLKPACYSNLPKCVVSRTFNDEDPVGRMASEVLERSIKVSLDDYDFDQVLKSVRDDFLLFARGVPWVRYEAEFGAAESAAPETDDVEAEDAEDAAHEQAEGEVVTDERTVCDHVCLEDFGTNTARTWAEVRFGYRRAYLTRDALKKRFTNKVSDEENAKTVGEVVPLDFKPGDSDTTDSRKTEQFAKAMIYEIWDKESKRVFWISRSYPWAPLDVRDDPLGLRDFFPFPKPAYGTQGNESVVPIPDYIFYQDQAEEVDDLTLRIGLLLGALRMVGIYAGEEKLTLQQVFKQSSENQMIPVDSWGVWAEKGGIKGIVEWVPVDMVKDVLQGLFEARRQMMDDIYQITGISDIMRGDTEASETATAQQIKSTWGSSRVREKQKEIARVARDIMRIMGEVISEKYGIETLQRMTNVKLLREAEKQAIQQWQQAADALKAQQEAQQQAMQAQQPPPQPGMPQPMQAGPQVPVMQPPPPPFPPEMMALVNEPTWEEVKALLENEGQRMFRIDVEADSTIDADMDKQQAAAVEYVTSIGGLLAQALPAVQAAPPLGGYLGAVIKAVGRLYPFGRQFEEEMDKAMKAIGEMPGPANAEQPEAKQGKSPEELLIEERKVAVQEAGIKQKQEGEIIAAQTAQIQSRDKKEIELAKIDSAERIARLEATVAQMAEALARDAEDRAARQESMVRVHEANTEAETRRYETDNAPAPKSNGAG